MPDRGFVLHLVLRGQPGLLKPRCFLVDQPRMRPPVGQTVGRVAGELAEGIVDFDHGSGAIGYEEALLERIHHRIAELVAVGEVFGAGPLFLVTLCAVEESARHDVERGQCL